MKAITLILTVTAVVVLFALGLITWGITIESFTDSVNIKSVLDPAWNVKGAAAAADAISAEKGKDFWASMNKEFALLLTVASYNFMADQNRFAKPADTPGGEWINQLWRRAKISCGLPPILFQAFSGPADSIYPYLIKAKTYDELYKALLTSPNTLIGLKKYTQDGSMPFPYSRRKYTAALSFDQSKFKASLSVSQDLEQLLKRPPPVAGPPVAGPPVLADEDKLLEIKKLVC